MRLTNQVLFCHPPTQSVYQNLIRQLQEWQNIVLRLPRIQAQRYQVGLSAKQSDIDLHYRSVMSRLPSGNLTMDRVYKTVASVNTKVDEYVAQWLHYQVSDFSWVITIFRLLPVWCWPEVNFMGFSERGIFHWSTSHKKFLDICPRFCVKNAKLLLPLKKWT